MIDVAFIDRLMADLVKLRAALAPADPIEPVDAPAPPDDMIDTWTAAMRFNLPVDSVRWLAREKCLGEKHGGRWMISASALRKYLGHSRFTRDLRE